MRTGMRSISVAPADLYRSNQSCTFDEPILDTSRSRSDRKQCVRRSWSRYLLMNNLRVILVSMTIKMRNTHLIASVCFNSSSENSSSLSQKTTAMQNFWVNFLYSDILDRFLKAKMVSFLFHERKLLVDTEWREWE